VHNTSTDPAVIRNVTGVYSTPIIGNQNDYIAGDITIRNNSQLGDSSGVAGFTTTNEFAASDTADIDVGNSYNYYANGWNIRNDGNNIANNTTVDNHVGFYMRNSTNGNSAQNPTNVWSFYSGNPDYLARPGALELFREHAYESTHSASGTYTVDANNGNLQTVTLGANITSFTMSNFPSLSSKSVGITLYLVQDGTGARTISFTAGASETFKFANGSTSSTVSAAADIQTVYIFSKYNGSSLTYYWTLGPAYS